jgi:hypothetical protein
MKKTYKAPLTEVVKINAEQMICQSSFSLSTSRQFNSSTMQISSKEDEEVEEDLW